MNIVKINEIRAAAGLPALAAKDNRDQKRRQAANKAARAQESRDLKAARAKRGK